MSEFFKQIEKKEKCSCKASSFVYKEDNIEFKFFYNRSISCSFVDKNIDILILLEYWEKKERLVKFKTFCEFNFRNYNYVIMPALGCTPSSFSSEDTIVTYRFCKERHIKKRIQNYNPKIILTVGRALYTITESKDLQPEHFFVPVNDALQKYQEDDTYFYSPEFDCKIIPLPPLFHWIGFNEFNQVDYKDCYEKKFAYAQAKRLRNLINEKRRKIPKLNCFNIEDSTNFLNKLIHDDSIYEISMDTESSGLNYFKDELYCIQFSYNGIDGYFSLWKDIDKELLIKLFDCKNKYFVFQNASHDIKFLKANGIYNARCDFDTMLASWQLNENSPQGQKPNTWIYTYYGGYEEEMKSFMKENKIKDFTKVPLDVLSKYSTYDAIIAFQLYKYFKNRLEQEDEDVKNNFYNYVMPSLEMIIDVEITGIPVDLKYFYEYNGMLENELKEVEKKIFKIVGYEFNVRSPKELTKALYSIPNFQPLKDGEGKILLSKNGDLLLNKQTLPVYEKKGYEIANLIKKHGHLSKEISQLGISKSEIKSEIKKEIKNSGLFSLINEEESNEENDEGFLASIYNGRLYSSYKLYGTATGRASGGSDEALKDDVKLTKKDSFGINPQNIPTREEFRKVFLPEENCVLGNADYDSMEVSIFSQMSGKGVLEDLILSGKDMHCYTFIPIAKTLKEKGLKDFYLKYKDNLPLKTEEEINHYLLSIDWENINYEEVEKRVKVEGQEDPFFVEMRSKVTKIMNWQCFSKETKIRTNKGIKQISEIVPEINSGNFTDYKGNIKLLSRCNKEKYISHTFYKNKSEILDIELENGDIISVSPDHEMIILKEGKEYRILAKNLKGDEDLLSV